MNTHRDLSRRTSILALLVVFCLGNASIAAEDQTVAKDKKSKDEELSEIVVTGSLIPQAKVETSTPVTVITAADIEARGFATVADALQRASFSTGGIEGPQFSGGFTQTANSLSFFGLSPSYVKYLIDGRPMSDYPALYNGTDTIGSISGIPTVLVDHVDILPGAQSSIYGSDAIAGVVNVVIKKKFDAPVVDVRYGGYTEGGGKDLRLAVADGFSVGPIDVTVGGQYEGTAPIWGYQRDLTNKYYNEGAGPQVAERDYLVFGYFGQQPSGNTYYFLDPNNCANVAGQFGGSVGVQTRPGRGQFCGTTTSGYYTIGNDVESTQGYLHASDDITDHLQLFADALVSHDQTRFDVTQGFYGTTVDTNSPAYYYYDPNLQDFMNLQHIFSPEEAGGLRNTEDKNTNNSLRATLGLKGQVGTSWNFSFDWTYTQNKLTENTFLLLTQPLEAYFNNFLGPETVDPVNGPSFSPNYANFYKPVPTSAYSSFGGILTNYSQTEENFLRGQLTNGSLFTLPGGDAGVALEVDGGDQGWFYDVDPRYLDGTAYGYTSVGSSSGHRSRYAVTGELRLPIVKMLTLTGSARYDKYNVASSDFTKTTYNLGLEFRPIEKLLFRGRYGTAFKAPTLSDEYQAKSGYFETLTDYYLCATQGYTAAKGNLDSCAQANQSYNGSTAGNTSLKPITAKVWDLGFVWSPLDRFSLTGDIIDWRIDNEVAEQQADSLLKTEADCRLGTLDINSPTCVAALSQVTRGGPQDTIINVYTPKINVSNETLKVLIVGFNYKWDLASAGELNIEASYSDVLRHDVIQYPGDPRVNVLQDPTFAGILQEGLDFKTKGNASVTYTIDKLHATVYGEYYGKTANYAASVSGYGTPLAGDLDPWKIVNMTVGYDVTPGLYVHATLTNVFNEMPPVDHSYPGTQNQPYDIFNYNVYGRGYYLGATYKIGK